jgi:RNA polymerase sigma-70 factor (ECF subfamily)
MNAVARHLYLVPPAGAEEPARARPTMGPMSRRDHAEAALDPAQASFERVRLGDESAFAQFYDEVGGVVYGTVLRVIRNPAQAEEVTQEVFVELWRTAARFDPTRGSVRTWAATMAHRRAVDRVRSEQSARDREVVDATREIVHEHDHVVEEVTASLDRERVAQALRGLTEPQREAVTMAYYGGLTYREVAIRLDLPEGTVKTRIRDGLIKLRDLMGVAS